MVGTVKADADYAIIDDRYWDVVEIRRHISFPQPQARRSL